MPHRRSRRLSQETIPALLGHSSSSHTLTKFCHGRHYFPPQYSSTRCTVLCTPCTPASWYCCRTTTRDRYPESVQTSGDTWSEVPESHLGKYLSKRPRIHSQRPSVSMLLIRSSIAISFVPVFVGERPHRPVAIRPSFVIYRFCCNAF